MALDLAAKKWGKNKMTRVGESFYQRAHVNLVNWLIHAIHTHPTKGKTLQ